MQFDETSLVWSLFFGIIGFAYFSYGRKQKRPIPLVSGIGLMIYPYFVSGLNLLIIIGVCLIALPYFVRTSF